MQASGLDKVYVVVLNWNRHDVTLRCLESLARCGDLLSRVLVIDNGSTAPGVEEIGRTYPDVTVLRSDENLGFSAGCNVGIRRALELGAETVVLLNSDVVVEPDFLPPLVAALEGNPAAGAASGCLGVGGTPEAPDRVVDGASSRRQPSIWAFNVPASFIESMQPDLVTFASGCFLALRRPALEAVGLLDEAFFFGSEDADLSWRLRDAGFEILRVPESRIWHEGGASRQFGLAEYRSNFASRCLLMRKHLGSVRYGVWLVLHTILSVLRLLPGAPVTGELMRHQGGRFALLKATLQASFDALRGRLETRPHAS